jgi:hypothetical protein
VVLAAAGHAQAFAYSVAKGNGHSTAKVAVASKLTVSGSQASGWDKKGDAVPVTATISNPNRFHYWAHTVTARVTGTDGFLCDSSDFSVEGSPVTVERAVAARGTLSVTGLSVRLAKQASGFCKFATVTLTYSVS